MIYLLKLYIALLVPALINSDEKTASSPPQSADRLVIAFGSCNREYAEQPMWAEIMKQKPDLWIWLGDNIYGDTDNMDTLEYKYQKQLNNSGYKEFMNNTEIVGTWDDHDYGINDGGTGYREKVSSQQHFLDFIGEPNNTPRRRQEGIYASYLKTAGDLLVKIILLDTRYHRDTLYKKKGAYLPNESGDILGKRQWQWLEEELKDSNADIHIIASSIQVVSEQHAYEKWANFPNSRQRLFNLIAESKARGVLFLSGDRHIAEFSKIQLPGMDYPLYDLTSSGLTHTWRKARKEKNRYRVGPLLVKLNYGVLHVKKEQDRTVVEASVRGSKDALYFKESFAFEKQ